MNQPVSWSPGVTLEMIEKQVILCAFRFYRGVKTSTANSLGISVRTLEAKLEKYEQDGLIQREREDSEERDRSNQLDRHRGIVRDPKTGTPTVLGNYTGTYAPPIGETGAAGLREKSATDAKPLHDVPVSQRQETKMVLPEKTAAHSSGRRR